MGNTPIHKLEVVKDRSIEWPCLEDDTHIMTTGSGCPLVDCIRIAQIGINKVAY